MIVARRLVAATTAAAVPHACPILAPTFRSRRLSASLRTSGEITMDSFPASAIQLIGLCHSTFRAASTLQR
jgi:hypothetical protein